MFLYKKTKGFAHPFMLLAIVGVLVLGSYLAYSRLTPSKQALTNQTDQASLEDYVLGVEDEAVGRVVLNGGFAQPKTEPKELAKYWVFSDGRLGKVSAEMVRAQNTELAKAEAVRIDVDKRPSAGNPALNQADVDLEPKTTYEVSFVARSSNPGEAYMVFRDMGYIKENLAPVTTFELKQGWNQYSSTVTTKNYNPNKAAVFSLAFKVPSGTNMVIDNVIVMPSTSDGGGDDDGGGDNDPDPIIDTDNDGVPDSDDFCPTEPQGNKPDPGRPGCPLKEDDSGPLTKKWNPGHYIQHKAVITPAQVAGYFDGSDPRYNKFQGVHLRLYWSDLENEKDKYTMNNIQKYLDALPQDKHALVLILDRDVQAKSCATARVPKYLKQSGDVGQMGKVRNGVFQPGNGCIANYWETDVRDREIKMLKIVAETFDNNPKFEGVLLGETTWGATREMEANQTLSAYETIHRQAAPSFKKSHLIKMMNHLGGGGDPCAKLRSLANTIEEVKGGIGNPDSVPWDALPWDCKPPVRLGETRNDKSKPVYTIYRENNNTMPKIVGNDTSQLMDPDQPRLFNNERMTVQNLVKYHYLTAVKGYTHKSGERVPGFGANYLLWNSNFWSIDTANSGKLDRLSREYVNAYLNFVNQPNTETNTTCPANIRCQR